MAEIIPLLTKALGETVYMVVVSMVIASAIGVPLGVLLHMTARNIKFGRLPVSLTATNNFFGR